MIDLSWVLHAMREARWEGLVLIGRAVWTDVLAYWWFGPLLAFLLLTAGRKKIARLAARIAGTYWSAHH